MSEDRAVIYLASGGSVTVTLDLDVFALSDDDFAFLIDMVRLIRPRLDAQHRADDTLRARRAELRQRNNRAARA